MDKLLSENLNRNFFKGIVPLEVDTLRDDGKIVVRQKGTLALLEEWIRTQFSWDDVEAAVLRIASPLRQVRAFSE